LSDKLQDADGDWSISSTQIDFGDLLPYVAEEVHQGGLAAADARSDIAALCNSLLTLFEPGESRADHIRDILESGCAPKPADRPTLDDLVQALAGLTPADAPTAPPPCRPPTTGTRTPWWTSSSPATRSSDGWGAAESA
jgi:hypothetical protein